MIEMKHLKQTKFNIKLPLLQNDEDIVTKYLHLHDDRIHLVFPKLNLT